MPPMLVLIDESLPSALGRALTGHEARTVRQMGWNSVRNGELLKQAADAGFGAFVTADRSIEYQQDIGRLRIGLVVLRAPSNRLVHVLPLVPAILEALAAIQPGQAIHVGDWRGGRRRRSGVSSGSDLGGR